MNQDLETVKISELPTMGSAQLEGEDVVPGVVDGKTVAVPVDRIAALANKQELVDADEFNELWAAAP